jgi:hypothetical protein
MYEIVGKTPLKELAQIQLVLTWIPTKALYKLQVSFAQKVQSRARTNAMELQQTRYNRDELELLLEQDKIETKYEKDRTNRLEHEMGIAYDKIPKSTKTVELIVTQKIDHIVQIIDQFRQEIEHLWELLIPTNPPEVKEKRKQEETTQIKEIE